MRMFAAAVALVTLLASPAFVLYRLDRPSVGPNGEVEISAARAQALRECNAVAAQWGPEYEWGNTPMYHYRACMTEHGQVE